MVSAEQVSAFERGKTSEADVVAKLGPPSDVYSHNGLRTLIYSGTQEQARPAWSVPGAGPSIDYTIMRTRTVILRFDPAGKLLDVVGSQLAGGQ